MLPNVERDATNDIAKVQEALHIIQQTSFSTFQQCSPELIAAAYASLTDAVCSRSLPAGSPSLDADAILPDGLAKDAGDFLRPMIEKTYTNAWRAEGSSKEARNVILRQLRLPMEILSKHKQYEIWKTTQPVHLQKLNSFFKHYKIKKADKEKYTKAYGVVELVKQDRRWVLVLSSNFLGFIRHYDAGKLTLEQLQSCDISDVLARTHRLFDCAGDLRLREKLDELSEEWGYDDRQEQQDLDIGLDWIASSDELSLADWSYPPLPADQHADDNARLMDQVFGPNAYTATTREPSWALTCATPSQSNIADESSMTFLPFNSTVGEPTDPITMRM